MKKYDVRCWDFQSQMAETYFFTKDEIINLAQVHHMNMVDVGLILLNIEREKIGLEPLPVSLISGEGLRTVESEQRNLADKIKR